MYFHFFDIYSKFLNRILDYHKATQNPTPEQPKREPEQLDVSDPELQLGLANFNLVGFTSISSLIFRIEIS